jgi:hypothetical protein
VAYDRFYNRYQYHGVDLEVYAPVRYYPAAYYGFAYAPWAVPTPYVWGWAGNPWAVYYGGYFTPYSVYPSPAFWLTDYMISATLAAEYQARLDAASGVAPQAFAAPPAALTPEVKAAISAEVQRQIALENAEAQLVARNAQQDPASSGIARILSDNTAHVFVVGGDLTAANSAGQCSLSQGDVVQFNPQPLTPNATTATLLVVASKPQDCQVRDAISVQLADLQDMQNHMREKIDQGLAEMQTAKGLPPIPASAKAAPVDAPFAAVAPPPDPNVAAQIVQQVQEADRAEQQVSGQTSASSAPAAPREPKVGMTVAEIEATLGQPNFRFSGAGDKTTYSYKDPSIKVVFTAGKVTDIQ